MDADGHRIRQLVRRQMAAEGRRIVDVARRRGVTLRLLGGLAVAEHCAALVTCERDHADVDLAGLRRESTAVVEVFSDLGCREREHIRAATAMRQAQFIRICEHRGADGRGRMHTEDHVDVFFDRFRLDHGIDLRDRLTLHPYTLSSSDLLATKLQMAHPEPRDVDDALHLLAVSRDGVPGHSAAIDAPYLAALCAGKWGLFYDVTRNLQRCAEALASSELGGAERRRAASVIAHLTGAIDAVPKSMGWRLRARVGTRRRWYDIVEEQGEEKP